MDKVLVTGAAGFLGSHVSNFLLDHSFEVVQSDIQLPASSDGNWTRADLRDMSELVEATRGVDAICHLGGIGDVYQSERSPELAMLVNACGTVNLIEAAKRNSVRRFVYASTWEVYGDARWQPVDESHPCMPRHPYSISKLAGDLATQHANFENSISSVVLRLGTAYGSRMRMTAVIPAYLAMAARGEPIQVHGAGDQFRQFTHVTDIAEAFRLALVAKNPSRVYNVVSPRKVTVLQLAQAIASRYGVGLKFREPRAHEVASVQISSHLIEKELGWRASVSFEKGLDELVKESRRTPALPS